MADMIPTPEDLARDATADLALITPYTIYSCEKSLLSDIAKSWIRRAISAEARLNRLEILCGELGTRGVSNARNAEDSETLHECLLELAESLKSIGENARRPAT